MLFQILKRAMNANHAETQPQSASPEYLIGKAEQPPSLDANWDSSAWVNARTLEINQFRPESSGHRPRTRARLFHNGLALHGIFKVQDRYVRCTRTEYFADVWKDSCVEFFVQPKDSPGYFNFEFNCGGAFLCSYIEDSERTKDGFKKFTRLPPELGQMIRVGSSMPRIVDPEVTEPIDWTLQFFIPFTLFKNVLGFTPKIEGQLWRGNFFKCAEELSHPHWASWSPVDEFNFHLPRCFGTLRFA